MRKIDAGLVREAETFMTELFDKRLSPEYLFHSKQHTLDVAKNAAMIGHNSGLTEDEINMVLISALFHDAGYVLMYENHEAESIEIASGFLRSRMVGEPEIKRVAEAIMATKVPQHPTDCIGEVLCDADLMHLAGDDYFERMELLRLEWQITGRNNFTELQFHLNSIDFFYQHHFHSEYGKTAMQDKKAENLRRIGKRVESLRRGSS